MASVISANENIVSFRTSEALPFSGARIEFGPVQAGSVDPSPENIREITGWTGIDLNVAGKNLFDVSTPIEYGEYHTTYGNWTANPNRIATDFISIKSGETYTFSVKDNNIDNLAFNNYSLFDKNKTWLGARNANGDTVFSGSFSHTFTINMANAAYIRVIFRDATDSNTSVYGRTLENVEFQFEHNSTATSFSPYSGTNLSVTFPQTVYGGWCNPFTGVGVIDRAVWILTPDNIGNWTYTSMPFLDSYYFKPMGFAYPGDGSIDIGSQATIVSSSSRGSGTRLAISSSGNVAFADFATSLQDFQDKIAAQYNNGTPVTFCLRLATPQSFTFTPVTLSTLVGVNNFWSNANGSINEVAYRNKSLNIETYRDRMKDVPHVSAATGAIASFQTDMISPVKSLVCNFSPVQAVGTPTPSNVIPITGWDGLDIFETGENLFDINELVRHDGYYINDSGVESSSSASGYTQNYIEVTPGGTYTITGKIVTSTWWAIYYYDSSKNFLSRLSNLSVDNIPKTFTVPNDCKYIRIQYNFSVVDFSTWVIWETAIGSTSSVTFPSTIYGGYVDPVKGKLVATWLKRTLNRQTTPTTDFTNSADETYGCWQYRTEDRGAAYAAAIRDSNPSTQLFCDKFTVNTERGANNATGANYIIRTTPWTSAVYGRRLYLSWDNMPTDRSEYLSVLLDDIQPTLVWLLETPIEYNITPTQLKTLYGRNNICSSGNGDTECSFYTHGGTVRNRKKVVWKRNRSIMGE